MSRLRVWLGMLLAASPVGAQAVGEGVPRLQWQGEAGTFAEAYGISGREARRPGQTGRLYLNSTAKLYGKLSVGVNLLLSTEGDPVAGFGGIPGRQRINQLGVSPRW